MNFLEESAGRFYKNFSRDYTEEKQLLDEYCSFSRYIQDMFIKSSYVIYTGNFQNVNKVMIDHFEMFRRKHPILFKIAVRILCL